MLLSHHPPEHEGRCVVIGGVPLCARCLGMYPPLVLGVALQLASHRSHADVLAAYPGEDLLLIAAMLPAVVDWVRGRIDPATGSNFLRLTTGALLGAGLARTLYLNARSPMEPPAVYVIVFLVAAVVLGDLVSRAYSE